MAKRDRSTSLLFVALCAAVSCTAIVEGELERSSAGPPLGHGSQSSLEGVGGARTNAGDTSAEHGGLGGQTSDSSGAGAANEAGGAGAASAVESGGAAGAGDQPLENGGMAAGGAEQAAAGDATGGEPTSGGAGSSGAAGGGAVPSEGTKPELITWQGPLPIGDPKKGHLLVIADKCAGCHAEDLGGRGYYRNITPDVETGIGSWTDRQIANAIRGGGGPGTQFCSVMPLYSGLKDQQIADMVAYLRSVPAISNKIVSMCPGHYPPGGR